MCVLCVCVWIIGLDWCCYQCYKLKRAKAFEQRLNSHLEMLAATESNEYQRLIWPNKMAKTIREKNTSIKHEVKNNNNNKCICIYTHSNIHKRASIKTKQMSESLTLKESIRMMLMTAKTSCKEFVRSAHPLVWLWVNSYIFFFSHCIQNDIYTKYELVPPFHPRKNKQFQCKIGHGSVVCDCIDRMLKFYIIFFPRFSEKTMKMWRGRKKKITFNVQRE